MVSNSKRGIDGQIGLENYVFIKEEIQINLNDSNNRLYHYNLRRRPIEYKLEVRVLKRVTKLSNKADRAGKLYDKFEGPFIIKKKIYPTLYELKTPKAKIIGEWNINDLKLEM